MSASHIRKVALVGGTGNLGSYFLKSLLATGKHSITVLTRAESEATFPDGVDVVKVDYTSADSVTSALQGHDFLIITLSSRSPPELHPLIVNAAAKAGVKYIMPNYYGYALSDRTSSSPASPILSAFERFTNDVKSVEDQGVKWVALCCGFWYEFSVGMGEEWLGFDIEKRKVTFYDDGNRKINTSTWEVCGRAVASLLSLPTEKQGDDKPALSDWDGKGLYISSFLVSQRDILNSLHRILNTTDADWTISYQPVEERYEQGMKELQEGKMTGFAKALYTQIFYPNGRGDYETGWGLDNGKLGIEKEDLDVATKRAVGMVGEGFGYRG